MKCSFSFHVLVYYQGLAKLGTDKSKDIGFAQLRDYNPAIRCTNYIFKLATVEMYSGLCIRVISIRKTRSSTGNCYCVMGGYGFTDSMLRAL